MKNSKIKKKQLDRSQTEIDSSQFESNNQSLLNTILPMLKK